jgi:hypothetical protein
MAESFWKIPDVTNVKVPLLTMKEQAAKLTDDTKGLLRGIVSTVARASGISIDLYVSVPTLNGYSVKIFEYYQPETIYPGELEFALANQGAVQIASYEDFEHFCKMFLASEETERVVGALLA